MFDPAVGEVVDAAIVERSELSTGQAVPGPAVIIEPQTTTVLGSHHRAVLQRDGTLLITRTAPTRPAAAAQGARS